MGKMERVKILKVSAKSHNGPWCLFVGSESHLTEYHGKVINLTLDD
jgi:hypothetical protein